MSADFFIKGLIIGFSVAAPVGPIGVLTIKRTLTEGRISGLVTGLGAALADAVYGLVAGFGLTAVSSFLLNNQIWLKILGGCFLIFLGVKSMIIPSGSEAANVKSKGLFHHFISTFFLTITNPTTILSFLAIFAAIGLGAKETDYNSSVILVLGVLIGSAIWWLILSTTVGFFKSQISSGKIRWINIISGFMMISFGLYSFYSCIPMSE